MSSLTFDGTVWSDGIEISWSAGNNEILCFCGSKDDDRIEQCDDLDVVKTDEEHLDVIITDKDICVEWGPDDVPNLDIKGPVSVEKLFEEMGKFLNQTVLVGETYVDMMGDHIYYEGFTAKPKGDKVLIIRPIFGS